MKIITFHKPVDGNKLLAHLQQKLNILFRKQRQERIIFQVDKTDHIIEISESEIYKDVLFRLEIKGQEIWITRNEHYVDDVNSLTVESILNNLFEDLSDNILGFDLLLEG